MNVFEWIGTGLSLVGTSLVSIFGIQLEESPAYAVAEKDGRVEVRQYGPRLLAVTETSAGYEAAQERNFRVLAGYIFGGNRQKKAIAMTTPVVQPGSGRSETIPMTTPVTLESAASGRWSMAFMMPSKYTRSNLPEPNDPSIRIVDAPAETLAVVRRRGGLSAERIGAMEAELRAWLDRHPAYAVAGEARIAGYNPPFTIPFLKRTEVMIPIRLVPGGGQARA